VLHWNEQDTKYAKLDLEVFPRKQRLRLLQNAIGDVTDLSYIKKISDQELASGYSTLEYDAYMELLLSACSTYFKKLTLPGKQRRAVYLSEIRNYHDTYDEPDGNGDVEYHAYRYDNDVSDIMINMSDVSRFINLSNGDTKQSVFIPRDE
jgi:hypothetical protein